MIIQHDIVDEMLKILSCNTRRDILSFINCKPNNVREISKNFGLEIITIKRHMKLLLSCDLVIQIRIGNSIFYQTNQNVLEEIIDQLKLIVAQEEKTSESLP